MIESGFVYIPEAAPWLAEYLHEMMVFPKGKHDDQVDSTAQFLDWYKRPFPNQGYFEWARQKAQGPPRAAQTATHQTRVGDRLDGMASRAGRDGLNRAPASLPAMTSPQRGTESSNLASSTGESANHLSRERFGSLPEHSGGGRPSSLAWLLAKPVITAPIVGATKLHQLDDALASVGVKLTAEEIAALEEPYVPHAVVGFV